MKFIPIETHIKIFNEIHNEKFRKNQGFDHYDYSLINEENYKGVHSKIPIMCNIHNYIFEIKVNSHKSGVGCKKCFDEYIRGKFKLLSNEIVDDRLKHRNIKRLDEYVNGSTNIKWECLKCHMIWVSTPNNVVGSQQSGCHKCAGYLKLTNDIVDERLSNSNIKRVGDIINSSTPINWMCTLSNCNYVWKTNPNTLIHKKSGCPKCSGTVRLTNEEVDKRLGIKGIMFKRMGNVKNSSSKILWQCNKNTEHKWEATVKNVINNKTGCPKCKNYKGEIKVETILREYNLKFNRQFSFKDCKYKKKLRFDFVVYKNDGSIWFLIEYQGEQHYNATFWLKFGLSDNEAKEQLRINQTKDKIKQEYCTKNSIKLIIISYKEKNIESVIKHHLLF